MRIFTLGTSHGDSTFCRFNSCTVYETNGRFYAVDAGAPAEALMRRKGIGTEKLRAVFISHMHDDHTGGLSGIIKQATKYKQNRAFPLSIYLPEKTAISALKNWVLAVHEPADDELLRYNDIDDGVIYSDDWLTVTAIRTDHLRTHGRSEGAPCSFAFVLHFKIEDIMVLHTGDLRRDLADFPKIAFERSFDVCVTEATHYNPKQGSELFGKADFGRIIFTHIYDLWHNTVADDGTVYNGEERLLANFAELPYPTEVAHDGDVFEISK